MCLDYQVTLHPIVLPHVSWVLGSSPTLTLIWICSSEAGWTGKLEFYVSLIWVYHIYLQALFQRGLSVCLFKCIEKVNVFHGLYLFFSHNCRQAAVHWNCSRDRELISQSCCNAWLVGKIPDHMEVGFSPFSSENGSQEILQFISTR